MLVRKETQGDPGPHRGPKRRVRASMSMASATSGLTVGRLRVLPEHVVFVKGVVEASEGLAGLFAERGGDLLIASPNDRAAELRELLLDLAADLDGSVNFEAPPMVGAPISSIPSR